MEYPQDVNVFPDLAKQDKVWKSFHTREADVIEGSGEMLRAPLDVIESGVDKLSEALAQFLGDRCIPLLATSEVAGDEGMKP